MLWRKVRSERGLEQPGIVEISLPMAGVAWDGLEGPSQPKAFHGSVPEQTDEVHKTLWGKRFAS